jgi:hypothetical protein
MAEPHSTDGDALARLAIEAHGGEDAWRRLSEVSLRVSCGGLAFATKGQGHALRALDATVATREEHVTFAGYPAAGEQGVLESDGRVRIVRAGDTVRERADPRPAFANLRQRLWWDRLDMLYFAASALWTYVSSPFVWLREGYALRELAPWFEGGERWRRLAVTFPDAVHTHCREQVFHIDAAGVIRRHDYTPEPFRNGVRAAHYCYDVRPFDGLLIASRRAVFPRRRDGRSRSWPRLVWIELSPPE